MGEPAVPAPGGERRTAMGEVVFETGQRWATPYRGTLILCQRVDHRTWDAGESYWTEGYMTAECSLLAPAPKPRQRWMNGGDGDVQLVDADGDIAAEDWDDGVVLCRGSVVDVARWLAERGYRCVSKPSVAGVEPAMDAKSLGEFDGVQFRDSSDERIVYTATHSGDGRYVVSWKDLSGYYRCASGYSHSYLSSAFADRTWIRVERRNIASDLRPLAALANAVAEIWTAPTREAGRRYVDTACNEIRGERYASAIRAALVAFSSDRADYGLRPVDIMAIIDACRTWEFNRSRLPFPNRKLTAAEVEQIIKPTHLAAHARLSWARAIVVAHLVADVYERARVAC